MRGVLVRRFLNCLMVGAILAAQGWLVLRAGAAQGSTDPDRGQVPSGYAEVEFCLPAGERVLINDRDLGTQLRYRPKAPEPWYRWPFEVQYIDGRKVLHDLLLRSGWFVRVPIPSRRPLLPELVVPPEDAAGICSVAFRPDGRQILAGLMDGTIALWEADRSPPLRVLAGHTGSVTAVAFSPDGQQVLSGSRDKTAILWDAANGQRLKTFEGHEWVVTSVAFCTDGQLVLTGSEDQTVCLWDVATGTRRRTIRTPAPVTSAAFSPDADRVLTGLWDRTAILWDTASGEEVRRYQGHRGWVTSVAFCPDGRLVVTGSEDKTAIIWDVESGKPLHTLAGHKTGIKSLAFATDRQQLLTASTDGALVLWEAAGGKRLQTFAGDSASVSSVALSPDGRQALTGSSDGCARLWDVATGDMVGRFIALAQGRDWLVNTWEGLFDGSPDARQKVNYRCGAECVPVPLARLSKVLHRPGLLTLMRESKRPLPDVDLNKSLPPEVRIVAPEPAATSTESQVTLEVEMRDRGGGVGESWLMHNGSRIADQDDGEPQEGILRRSFTVSLVPGENRLEARASNAHGFWESEPAVLVLRLIEQ